MIEAEHQRQFSAAGSSAALSPADWRAVTAETSDIGTLPCAIIGSDRKIIANVLGAVHPTSGPPRLLAQGKSMACQSNGILVSRPTAGGEKGSNPLPRKQSQTSESDSRGTSN